MAVARTFEVGFIQLQDWILSNFFNSPGCVGVMSDVGIPQRGEWCVLMRESSGNVCQITSIWENVDDAYDEVGFSLRVDWQNDMLGKWDYEVWHVLEDLNANDSSAGMYVYDRNEGMGYDVSHTTSSGVRIWRPVELAF